MDLSGRVAVVTGAGTGIGRAIALELSRLGASVGLLGRTRASLEAVAGEAKGETCVVTADVRERLAVEAAFDAIQARLASFSQAMQIWTTLASETRPQNARAVSGVCGRYAALLR